MAAAATAAMAWLGLYGFGWNDYEVEARPAVDTLVHGHLGAFFALAPVYGGSLLERAPFALAPSLWGGGELAVYRMLALPCLLAALALGLVLLARARSQGSGLLTQAVALGLCVANPLTLAALELGHPDELLGGALCVAAVLLAVRGRPAWAGLALGAAVANKQWALLALGPVLLALPARRALCVSVAGAVSVALFAPFALFGSSAFAGGLRAAATPDSTIFQPWQLWWFFGHHGHVVHGLFGAVKPGYRTAPAWPATISHPLIIAAALPLTLGAWLRLRAPSATIRREARDLDSSRTGAAKRPRGIRSAAARPAAAAALHARHVGHCLLPATVRPGAHRVGDAHAAARPRAGALRALRPIWVGCRSLPSFASADVQAAFFAAWSVPLAIGLGVALYGRPARVRVPRSANINADPLPVTPRRAEGSVALTR